MLASRSVLVLQCRNFAQRYWAAAPSGVAHTRTYWTAIVAGKGVSAVGLPGQLPPTARFLRPQGAQQRGWGRVGGEGALAQRRPLGPAAHCPFSPTAAPHAAAHIGPLPNSVQGTPCMLATHSMRLKGASKGASGEAPAAPVNQPFSGSSLRLTNLLHTVPSTVTGAGAGKEQVA